MGTVVTLVQKRLPIPSNHLNPALQYVSRRRRAYLAHHHVRAKRNKGNKGSSRLRVPINSLQTCGCLWLKLCNLWSDMRKIKIRRLFTVVIYVHNPKCWLWKRDTKNICFLELWTMDDYELFFWDCVWTTVYMGYYFSLQSALRKGVCREWCALSKCSIHKIVSPERPKNFRKPSRAPLVADPFSLVEALGFSLRLGLCWNPPPLRKCHPHRNLADLWVRSKAATELTGMVSNGLDETYITWPGKVLSQRGPGCTRTISQKTPVLRYSRHRNSPRVSPSKSWVSKGGGPGFHLLLQGLNQVFTTASGGHPQKKLWKIGRNIRACWPIFWVIGEMDIIEWKSSNLICAIISHNI